MLPKRMPTKALQPAAQELEAANADGMSGSPDPGDNDPIGAANHAVKRCSVPAVGTVLLGQKVGNLSVLSWHSWQPEMPSGGGA